MKNREQIDELAVKWLPRKTIADHLFNFELDSAKRTSYALGFAAGQLEMKEDMTLLIEWLQNHPHVLEKSAEEVIERFYLL